MKRYLLPLFVATTLFTPALASADAAAVFLRNPVNLKLTGQKQGAIPNKGDPTALTCVRLSHAIVSPRDPQSGLPTGQRQHKPLVCTVRGISKSIVRLFTALSTNENIQSAVFTGTGSDASMLTLTNANIASIDTRTDPEGFYFEIAFTYHKIKWEKDGVSYTDDWEARV